MSVDILFLCGTLEPAKSGVADFILLLAASLSARGIRCACLAIHDPYVEPSSDFNLQHSNEQGIPLFRASSQYSWIVKGQLLASLLDDLQPDWISLHYVPYAFHAKGLPFHFLRTLLPFQARAQWEITAHELWLDATMSFRYRVLSGLQRYLFRRLCRKLKPVTIHVTNHAYQSQLKSCHIHADILPLFSSIPYIQTAELASSSPTQWTFVLFGSINRDWDPQPLLEQVERARLRHGIASCQFLSVGALDDYGVSLWDSLQSLPYPAFSFLRLGILAPDQVSIHLQRADFGVCVAPSRLIEKSSAVAAMLAHGLPIILTRLSADCDAWHRQLAASGRYILLDPTFASSLGSAIRYAPVNQRADTLERFASALSLA